MTVLQNVTAPGYDPSQRAANLDRKDDLEPRDPVTKTVVWTSEKLAPCLTRTLESLASGQDVVRVVVMPDVHEGPIVPNGCVVATRTLIYPEAVGRDIGCGVSAIRLDVDTSSLSNASLDSILTKMTKSVPALIYSRRNAVSELPLSCPRDGLSDQRLSKAAAREGILQLGTLGRGNHFVELQRDTDGGIWLMVHSGSRGMGEVITGFHLKRATQSYWNGLYHLDLSSDLGQAYFHDMQWCMQYATENRLYIINRVADLLEAEVGIDVIPETYINSPHNFARVEEHFGERLIVHRKSVNSAREGELGIIPGSMAAGSRIVSGRGCSEALHSSSHGAGRTMSRKQAADTISTKTLIGMMRGIAFQHERAGELCDEAPTAYKNLNEVMRAQSELVRTEKILSTLLNYKGFGS